MNNNKIPYDITIIGGGPVGMFAGFYSGLRNAKAQIIESLPEFGGQPEALYPEKDILDVAGFPNISGKKLSEQLVKQLKGVKIDKRLNEPVINVKKQNDLFEIFTPTNTYYSKAIILATGKGAFKPRELQLPNLSNKAKEKIFYHIENKDKFRNKIVVVAGGGNSAIDFALSLEKVAKKVYLVHRRNEFRGLEHLIDKLKDSKVEVLTPYLIKNVEDKDNQLEIKIQKMRTKFTEVIQSDYLIVNYGFVSNSTFLKNWDINVPLEHGLVKVDNNLESKLKGLYVIGDQSSNAKENTLIATGLGEGPKVVNNIMKNLHPDESIIPHSTALNL